MSAGTYFNSATFAFWVIGLLNNMPFVIMLAEAKSISEGGTALVFIANSLPSLLVKISSPYWFDKVSYGERMMFGSILMTFSFCFVAVFIKRGDEEDDGNKIEGLSFNVCMQLLGVAFGSAQAGLGEATLLALSGKADTVIMNARLNNGTEENGRYQVIDESGGGYERDSNSTEVHKKSMCITAFSSGTGFAGIAGFLYVFSFTRILGLSLPGTLTVGLIFPILYFRIFTWYLEDFTRADLVNEEIVECVDTNNPASNEMVSLPSSSHAIPSQSALNPEDKFEDNPISSGSKLNPEDEIEDNPPPDFQSDDEASDNSLIQLTHRVTASDTSIDTMTTCERFRVVLSLWPYMLPLFAVYAAEYALQSGVWAAIGFPVEDQKRRDSFYLSSNWVYQIGVFISRSSGAFFIAPMWMLWLMPFLQIVNLIVFYLVAMYHFWYSNVLLIGCFYVGLLGGGVYVHGYSRINKDLPVSVREFALSSASVADGLGIVMADIGGLFIQSCLYNVNGLDGAPVSCPL